MSGGWVFTPESLRNKFPHRDETWDLAYEFYRTCLLTGIDPAYAQHLSDFEMDALIQAHNDIQEERT